MSDPNVREIQLGGKQLLFLFMVSVVLAVAIFRLGISVGRGVGGPAEEVTAAPAADEPIGEMPPETRLTDEDRDYHNELQGQTTPAAKDPPPDEEPKPAAPAPTDTTAVAVAKPPAPLPPAAPAGTAAAETPPATVAAKPVPKPAAAPPARGWFVQVAAFKSRENADRQVGQLKAKGYSAIVQSDPGSLYRVRIGPFKDRAEATRTRDRLQTQDGIKGTIGQ
jgi:cell division septation protein DedD